MPVRSVPGAVPWHRRMEARVAAGIALLVAVSVSAMLMATMRVAVDRSMARAADELDAAHTTFSRLLDERARSATTLTRLVTELPVFRAHMTETRLRTDAASVDAMADRYRQQLGAQFCVVTDAAGQWIGSPGWPSDGAVSSLGAMIGAAREGIAGRHIVAVHDRLFLLIVEPVRFADEVLGTFSVGYALDDGVARQLAQATHCDVNLVAGRRLSGSSFGSVERAELERWLSRPDASTVGLVSPNGLWPLGQSRYVAGMFPLTINPGDGRADRLLLFQSWSTTQQFLNGLRAQFLAAGAIIFVVTLVGGIVFSRRTSQPLRDVAAAARDIATGDWERQVPLRGTAEATTLAEAFNDMSASLRRAHERLLHDAFHDHLTQLPNRALFLDRLEQAVARRGRRAEYLFAVLFIDLDRFKTVNDSIGHASGDRLLLEVSSRLTTVLRSNDTVARPNAEPMIDAHSNTLARVGGDEFTILLEDIQDPSDAVRVAERLHQAVTVPFEVDGHTIFPSASIGIAVSSSTHGSGADLIRDADIAMYRAKSSGGAQCAVFDTTMHQSAVERLQLETDMRQAFDANEFRLYYQPIVSIAESRIVGFEALIRWQHPTRGLLTPAAFLRVAEETGLVTRLDSWVLRTACAEARRWQLESPGEPTLSVSVNISAQGFGRSDLVTQVANAIGETGLDPHVLRLEITETVAMSDAERARTVLGQLKALGVRISLDDFGTGYSSLSYLRRFPVDTLKIDRSFVVAMDESDECREIIRTVVNLAMTLGLEVVAEGAETEAQIKYLESLHCKFGQGYFYSRPVAADQALRLPRVLTPVSDHAGSPRQDQVKDSHAA